MALLIIRGKKSTEALRIISNFPTLLGRNTPEPFFIVTEIYFYEIIDGQREEQIALRMVGLSSNHRWKTPSVHLLGLERGVKSLDWLNSLGWKFLEINFCTTLTVLGQPAQSQDCSEAHEEALTLGPLQAQGWHCDTRPFKLCPPGLLILVLVLSPHRTGFEIW